MEVTYYFDGMEDLYDNNMQKILVPSSKVVRCDMKPEMNASVVLKETLDSMENDDDFILVNFTNPDSLAHTGNLSACIHGLESVDECLKQIIDKANENFYEVVITSSHGNCEDMKDSNGDINVSNTTNKVPFIILNKEYNLKDDGSLIDVIPTLIDMYQINKPTEMTGESLIIR